jgi:hypothetical protein
MITDMKYLLPQITTEICVNHGPVFGMSVDAEKDLLRQYIMSF